MNSIYAILNTTNGQYYIGSATNLLRRWREHVSDLCRGQHHNVHLQRAWNKYGRNSFEFCVLPNDESKTLLECEQAYIDQFMPGYNISKFAS